MVVYEIRENIMSSIGKCCFQGGKLSDSCLKFDLFISTHMTTIFEILFLEHVLYYFMIDSDFQEKSLYHFKLFH